MGVRTTVVASTATLILTLGLNAWAQDDMGGDDETADTGEGDVVEDTTPVKTTVVAPVTAPEASDAAAPSRPDGFSVGIGAGFTFPQDVLTPNTVSARFRLASGLTFEPTAVLGFGTGSSKIETPFGDSEDTSSDFALMAGALVRIPAATRGPVDLEFLAGGLLGFSTHTDDPDGTMNAVTTQNISLTGVWGLSVEWFLSPHWSWSFDAINPFISFDRTSTDDSATDLTATDTSFDIGAIFAPQVRLMSHVYF